MTKKIYAALIAIALAAPLASSAEDAGVFKVPGTDSTIKFYGYVQTDLTFDLGARDPNVEGNDWATILPTVPLKNSFDERNKKNQLYLTARQSRFGIQTSTPTKIGNVGVKLEGDFNGSNLESGQSYTNSVLFRLRHAYGTVGGLLVGQTWTTFADLNSYADTVDFNGPGSTALVRQPMVRYTFGLGPGMSLALAAENAPGTDGNDYAPGSTTGLTLQTIPDFVGKFDYSGNWGSLSLHAVTTQYKRAAPATNLGGSALTAQGIGGGLSGAFKVPGGGTLVGYFAGGPGIGRYLFNTLANSAVTNTGTKLILWTAMAYHVGYTHVWNPEWRSNLVWSQTFVTDPKNSGVALATNQTNKTMSQLFVNTFYSFAKNAEFGIEYAYGERKTFDAGAGNPSLKGTQSRINASMHYNFF